MYAACFRGVRSQDFRQLDMRSFPEQIEIIFSKDPGKGWHVG